MNKLLVTAALAAAGLVGSLGAASATTFTLNYTGTVTDATDTSTFASIPGEVGKRVSGKIAFGGNLTTNPFPGGEGDLFDDIKWSLKVGSEPTLTGSDTSGGIGIDNSYGSGNRISFDVGPGPADLELILGWDPTSQPVTLASFPADDAAALLFFGGALNINHGTLFKFSLPVGYTFTIDSLSTAVTPLPASAWLFLAGLGSLGVTAWRRRALPAASAD